ncbi:MAG: glycosyltransferase family 1 protein [candidate division FCPU426 bacterium]
MKSFVLVDGRPAQGRPRGMGVYALRLVAALAGQSRPVGIKVALDRRAGDDPWPGLHAVERLWGTAGNPALWEQSVLPTLARRAGAGLLHFTANASALRSAVPHIVTIHDAIFLRPLREITGRVYPRQVWAHWYYRLTVRAGARRARRILTDSEHSQSELITKLHLPVENIRVVPLAQPHLHPALTEGEVHEILGELKIKQPYMLGFGAIDLRKNSANLVRAFARMPRSALQMLVLAGFEKAERSHVPTLASQLGLQDRLRILGYIPERMLTALFQGASVFAYPTRAEGFGLPLLQAFHLGVPVLTSKVGSIPELAANAVRYANPEDPRSICTETLQILTDPNEAHRMALAGYLQAKHFTWEATAQKTLANYVEALDGGVS